MSGTLESDSVGLIDEKMPLVLSKYYLSGLTPLRRQKNARITASGGIDLGTRIFVKMTGGNGCG
ncbi:MAG TPA: hypothetical protein VGF02_09440 [Pseudolabrys sp.]